MAGAFVLFPGWNRVPPHVRTLWALLLAMVIGSFMVPSLEHINIKGDRFLYHFALEIMIGACAALLGHIFMSCVEFAGHIFAMQAGLSNAFAQSAMNQEQGTLPAAFFSLFFMAFLWLHDWQHLLIYMMIKSYDILPVGASYYMWGDFMSLGVKAFQSSFLMALQMCSPVIVASLILALIGGLINRLTPSIPIFFMLQPFQILVAFMSLWLGIKTMISHSGTLILKSIPGLWSL
jgi:flagellar biosynthetic protein FliR